MEHSRIPVIPRLNEKREAAPKQQKPMFDAKDTDTRNVLNKNSMGAPQKTKEETAAAAPGTSWLIISLVIIVIILLIAVVYYVLTRNDEAPVPKEIIQPKPSRPVTHATKKEDLDAVLNQLDKKEPVVQQKSNPVPISTSLQQKQEQPLDENEAEVKTEDVSINIDEEVDHSVMAQIIMDDSYDEDEVPIEELEEFNKSVIAA